jgi:hypothetical protein
MITTTTIFKSAGMPCADKIMDPIAGPISVKDCSIEDSAFVAFMLYASGQDALKYMNPEELLAHFVVEGLTIKTL